MKVCHNTVRIITLKRATDPPGSCGTGKRTPQLGFEEVVLYCEYPYANRVPGESLKGHKKELTFGMTQMETRSPTSPHGDHSNAGTFRLESCLT